ncbi:hypothetical protein IE81DRAFT_349612 [Ceraceosorus guamensis]|uniref:Uncharacterized protein n=1 Tax=Ceraceosorus guamensis TaxID=1522189 RepID=A0A316VX52_9BASI|nr:hypothetical protein IE81DRAFT_349612 [Ceraceosorus guamensis]PWN40055.1 hypothetical protein IE81DRAFT_349612 [Ceraceosorus guamensis]
MRPVLVLIGLAFSLGAVAAHPVPSPAPATTDLHVSKRGQESTVQLTQREAENQKKKKKEKCPYWPKIWGLGPANLSNDCS